MNVTAQCKGITASVSDVYCSPHYVSINASPFFLELDLCGRIDAQQSIGTVRRGEMVLKLVKSHPGTPWGRLLADLPRPERLRRREESRAAAEVEANEALERKKKKAWDDSRWTLTKQMDLDSKERMRIEGLKQEEHAAEAAKLEVFEEQVTKAEGKLYSGKGTQPVATTRAAGVARAAPSAAAHTSLIEEVPPLLEGDALAAQQDIFGEEDVQPAEADVQALVPGAAAAAASFAPSPAASLPPPRASTKVTIKFTKQLLTAPARTKGNNADTDLPSDPLAAPGLKALPTGEGDISQRDPAWLKDRGDRYLRLNDWASAESAYNLSLEQFKERIMGQAIDCVIGCWSNRAVCRLRKGDFLAAAHDCTEALSLMSKARCVTEYPKTESQHDRCRLRLYMRRAAAYSQAHTPAQHRLSAPAPSPPFRIAGLSFTVSLRCVQRLPPI